MPLRTFGDEDVALLQMLVRRHVEAAKMTGRAVSHSEGLEVRRLAKVIQTTEQSEADTVRRWLIEAGAPVAPSQKIVPDRHEKSFRQSSGVEYDRLFLATLIAHHQESIHLIETVVAGEQQRELHDFVQRMVATRTKQIDNMRELLFR